MDTKDKLIIEKLFKMAEARQKILNKLAQTIQDPNIVYLQQAWQVAAVNSGIPQVSSPTITATPGSEEANTQISGIYTIAAKDIPPKNDLRQKLLNVFKTQLKAQKPDLEDKVSVIFV